MAETILPHRFYPRAEIARQRWIGLGRTQLDVHVASGDLPPLVAPCEGSASRGYYGRTILNIQTERRRWPNVRLLPSAPLAKPPRPMHPTTPYPPHLPSPVAGPALAVAGDRHAPLTCTHPVTFAACHAGHRR